MAYRLLQEFRQAFTRLDTPPLSICHHPASVIALEDAGIPPSDLFEFRDLLVRITVAWT
jgi:hypothetical protein